MPRKPRSLVLTDNCTTHKVWRAHNKEYYLQSHRIKKLYINSLIKAQGEDEDYEINAITLMTNHVHEVMKIFKLKKFSDFWNLFSLTPLAPSLTFPHQVAYVLLVTISGDINGNYFY